MEVKNSSSHFFSLLLLFSILQININDITMRQIRNSYVNMQKTSSQTCPNHVPHLSQTSPNLVLNSSGVQDRRLWGTNNVISFHGSFIVLISSILIYNGENNREKRKPKQNVIRKTKCLDVISVFVLELGNMTILYHVFINVLIDRHFFFFLSKWRISSVLKEPGSNCTFYYRDCS